MTVDADFDDDGEDDLSRGELNDLGDDFSTAIVANDGADFSDYGKPVTGTASLSEKTAVSVVSQFVGGVYGSDINWGDFSRIEAHRDSWFSGNYPGCGGNAVIACAQITPPDRWVSITGRRHSFFAGSQYSNFRNLAVILTHESLHFQVGTLRNDPAGHAALQRRAQRLVRTRLGSAF
ncbi:hypothetical protein FGU71_03600 [Erythrobacter insulae]|uniref:Uncharacterized protein n=1 Tax=Erythrobacter insulae TaxID=2584124 RepID=A0A547PAG1_9SPHN|nr:hypothetical protein [Erythrobacter insulae]TRD11024.1 hypothetical protein FGU71_03600 [Erythrobacter insulae]